MKQVRRKHLGYALLAVVVAALAFLAAGCGGDGGQQRVRRGLADRGPRLDARGDPVDGKGRGRGEPRPLAGYADKSWADEFTKQTGCKVNTKDGANSDDMVDLIATGA